MKRIISHMMLLALLLLTFHDHLIPKHSHYDGFSAPSTEMQESFEGLHLHEQFHTYTFTSQRDNFAIALPLEKERPLWSSELYDFFTCNPPYRPPAHA